MVWRVPAVGGGAPCHGLGMGQLLGVRGGGSPGVGAGQVVASDLYCWHGRARAGDATYSYDHVGGAETAIHPLPGIGSKARPNNYRFEVTTWPQTIPVRMSRSDAAEVSMSGALRDQGKEIKRPQ